MPRRGGVHAGSTRASSRRRRVRPRAGADARRRRVRSRVRVRRRRIRPRRREIGRGIGRRLRGGFRPRGWFRRPPVHARLTAKVQRRPRRLRRRRRKVGGARGRGGFLFVVRYPVIVYVFARLVGLLVSRGGGGGCCGFAARVRVEERVAFAEDGRVESAAPAPSAEDGAHAADVVGGTLQRGGDARDDLRGETTGVDLADVGVSGVRREGVDRVEYGHPLARSLHLQLLHENGHRVLVVLSRVSQSEGLELVELHLGGAAQGLQHLQEARLRRPLLRHGCGPFKIE